MRNRRFRYSLLGVSSILALASLSGQADPWYSQKGQASYYGKGFHGKKTASGETFSQTEMTAAHRQLPLGSKVLVENLETGEKIEVKINDRGPYAEPKRRIIDLSKAAADSIGLVEQGVGPVRVTVTERPPTAKQVDEDMLYEVQLGAFEDNEQASAVLDQMKPWFPDTYMAPRNGPAGKYYRVRIGPFESKGEAQRIAASLKRGGHRVFLDEVPESAVPPEAGYEDDEGGGEKTSRKK